MGDLGDGSKVPHVEEWAGPNLRATWSSAAKKSGGSLHDILRSKWIREDQSPSSMPSQHKLLRQRLP